MAGLPNEFELLLSILFNVMRDIFEELSQIRVHFSVGHLHELRVLFRLHGHISQDFHSGGFHDALLSRCVTEYGAFVTEQIFLGILGEIVVTRFDDILKFGHTIGVKKITGFTQRNGVTRTAANDQKLGFYIEIVITITQEYSRRIRGAIGEFYVLILDLELEAFT